MHQQSEGHFPAFKPSVYPQHLQGLFQSMSTLNESMRGLFLGGGGFFVVVSSVILDPCSDSERSKPARHQRPAERDHVSRYCCIKMGGEMELLQVGHTKPHLKRSRS